MDFNLFEKENGLQENIRGAKVGSPAQLNYFRYKEIIVRLREKKVKSVLLPTKNHDIPTNLKQKKEFKKKKNQS